jgi:hypothetical protein
LKNEATQAIEMQSLDFKKYEEFEEDIEENNEV